MTTFPDFLFKLTERDRQVTPLEFVQFDLSSGVAAAASLTTGSYTVPKGKMLFVQNINFFMRPGAGQTADSAYVGAAVGGSSTIPFWGKSFRLAAAVDVFEGTMSQLLLPESAILTGVGNFNAGAAARSEERRVGKECRL